MRDYIQRLKFSLHALPLLQLGDPLRHLIYILIKIRRLQPVPLLLHRYPDLCNLVGNLERALMRCFRTLHIFDGVEIW